MQKISCYHCSELIKLEYKVSFREECPKCHEDMHICLNCRFYDESSYNECKESSAEKVKDKKSNNYCEYFVPISDKRKAKGSNKADQLKAAEALFKS